MVAIKRAIEPEIQEKAEAFGLSIQWVSKYDDEPIRPIAKGEDRVPRRGIQSNVWGLENGQITSLTILNFRFI